jgi:hypothetical protein
MCVVITNKVLKAVVYGDATLFAERPELMEAKVWVHFHSSSRKYNRIECWGPLKEATKVLVINHYPTTCLLSSWCILSLY